MIGAVRREFPGVWFFLHSCGKIDPIVPDVIELGFDILHPLQPECMDFAAVYRQYGGQIAVCATISAQRILPFGTPEDVRREVRRRRPRPAAIGVVSSCRRTCSSPRRPGRTWWPWPRRPALRG